MQCLCVLKPALLQVPTHLVLTRLYCALSFPVDMMTNLKSSCDL
jgi:hypothetical protein